MTIADVIDGQVPKTSNDVVDLQRRLRLLDADMNIAYDSCRRIEYTKLRQLRSAFLFTDIGFALITTGQWEV